jgi:5-methylcytosine-specific restriction protein A
MGIITNEMVQNAYKIGKQIYLNLMIRTDGIAYLKEMGMNKNSANDYVYSYSNLIQGKLFTRNTNVYATEYYLNSIFLENGTEGLQNALLSLSQHIDYYEEVSSTSVKKRKEIYNRYYDLIKDNYDQTIYADEVDPTITYSEGKTKKVSVNSFERNPLARKKCIEHYGLNCQVCNFNFQEKFGELGADFIHVHHKIDIATIGVEYSVNPIDDLIPVCPNCHAMLHKGKPNSFTIEELKTIIMEAQGSNITVFA